MAITRILIVGQRGQLATELTRLELPRGVTLEAAGRDQLDLSDASGIAGLLRASNPAAVINAAAYTAVDAAESDPAMAMSLNRDGPAALAAACADVDVPLVHVSTDFVFDGAKSSPYVETDPKAAINVYGQSKSQGEDRVLASGARATIIRTSAVYASHGRNFLRTMLKLAEANDEVRVVADQFMRPTWAADLAQAALATTLRAIERDTAAEGIFHYAGAGDASWADFAETIFAESAARGGRFARVKRITAAEFPTAARRPANARLDTTRITETLGIHPRDWREACARCVAQILSAST